MTVMAGVWGQLIQGNSLSEIKAVYRNVKRWLMQRSGARKLDAVGPLSLTHQVKPEVLQLCRDFYFKIWHDCGVMHLFAVDCILPEYRSVLDVGCGTALDAPLIMFRNPHCYYTGIDANEVAIAVARENMPSHRLIAGDFQDVNIGPERYDIAICLSVLEHTIDFQNVISKIVICARYEVVLGFYRGLSQDDKHLIQPVSTRTFWEPKYGLGAKRWEFSYLNTYSEVKLKDWLNQTFSDWEITFIRLHNSILKEFPRPVMVRLRRKSRGQQR